MEDFDKICRSCLNKPNGMISLFDKVENHEIDLNEMFTSVAAIQVNN